MNKPEKMSLILSMKPSTNFCNLFNDNFNDDFKNYRLDNLFFCNICDRGFAYKRNFERHLASDYHKRQVCNYKECVYYNDKLYCNICRKQFTSIKHFDNHSLSLRHNKKLIKKINKENGYK